MIQDRHESGKEAKSKVKSELEKRGYTVNLTRAELSVKNPRGKFFRVKVTSLKSRNAWLIESNPKDENHYFVLVFRPVDRPPEFSILTADEMQIEKQNYVSSRRKPLNAYSNPQLENKSLRFDQRLIYKDKWSSFPK